MPAANAAKALMIGSLFVTEGPQHGSSTATRTAIGSIRYGRVQKASASANQ